MTSLLERAVSSFASAYDAPPQTVVRAPGRVNLIGEHTDYNDGFVLPCAIDYETLVAASPRDDRLLRVVAADYGDVMDEFRVDAAITPRRDAPWANYVRGVAAVLQQRGQALRGAELAIAGNVPQGAGLSSSASLEVAVLHALNTLQGLGLDPTQTALLAQRAENDFVGCQCGVMDQLISARGRAGNVPQGAGLSSSASLEVAVLHALNTLQGLGLDPTQTALLAQRAENDFVGCQCGVMDQLISARGRAGHALLIDCRSHEAQPVPLPEDLAVMIVHSRVERGLVDSAYNERRRQCEAAARHFGVAALRDVDVATLDGGAAAGLDPLVLRRARHVVSENRRTQQAAEALAAGDLQGLGVLMAASHASMRDDFEITVPAIDRLVEIAQGAIGDQGGARMTGGGFGGCIVALLPQDRVTAVQATIEASYRSPNGDSARVWVCHARDGVGLVARGGSLRV